MFVDFLEGKFWIISKVVCSYWETNMETRFISYVSLVLLTGLFTLSDVLGTFENNLIRRFEFCSY